MEDFHPQFVVPPLGGDAPPKGGTTNMILKALGDVMKFIRYRPLIIAAIIFLVLINTRRTEAAGENLLFILDASGSMEMRTAGRVKMKIVKDALTRAIRGLPASLNVGLLAYGHRRKGDCKDVEMLLPMASLEPEVLIRKIHALTPTGMSAITLSLQKAAETLKSLKGKHTVVLIADGGDTCMSDPCKLIRELKGGMKFVIHAIGFDVTEEARQQLSCIAQAGSGAYFSARNAKELESALKNVMKTSGIPLAYRKTASMKREKAVKPASEKKAVKYPAKNFPGIHASHKGAKAQREGAKVGKGVTGKAYGQVIKPATEKKATKNADKLKSSLRNAVKKPAIKKGRKSAGVNAAEEILKASLGEKEKTRLSPDALPSSEDTAKVKVRVGLVRKEPSRGSGIRFRLKKGETVSVLETKEDWHHIKTPDGKSGWAHQSLFSKPDQAQGAGSNPTAEIRDIQVERTADGEKVIFVLTDFHSPQTLFLEKGTPKVVCDFPNTRLGKGMPTRLSVNGRFVKEIRVGLHKGIHPKLRVVSDLLPGRKYDVEHISLKNENRYVLIVRLKDEV